MRAVTIAAALWLGSFGPWSALRAETIRIGIAVNDATPTGQLRQLRDGFELGMRRSSHLLGGRDVTITQLPDGASAAAVDEFARKEKPQVLILDAQQAQGNAQIKALTDLGTIVIVPGLGPADLAGKRCLANVFVTGAQADQALDAIAAHADAVHGRRHILVQADAMNARADKLARLIKTELLRRVTLPASGDFQAEATRILADMPQAITLVARPDAALRFLTALRGLPGGATIPVLWPEGSDEAVAGSLGPLANGLIVPGGWATGLDTPVNAEFVASFEQAFGYLPSSHAVYAHDAARLLDVALAKTAEPTTAVALRDALHASAIDSPRGVVSFSNNNFPIQDFYIKRIEARPEGPVRSLPIAKIFGQFGDDFAAECPLR